VLLGNLVVVGIASVIKRHQTKTNERTGNLAITKST
jgi:hypothetical protein